MKTIFDKILTMILQGVLILSASCIKVDISNADDHLKQFDKFNITHHDNIDDTAETHEHKHKHSEDGQEHEHRHEHLKITQFDALKYHKSDCIVINRNYSFESSSNFYDNLHFSTEHLPDIFRPPIA